MGLFGLFYGTYVAGRWIKDTIRDANIEADRYARQIEIKMGDKKEQKQRAVDLGRTVYPYEWQVGYEHGREMFDIETDKKVLIANQSEFTKGYHHTCPIIPFGIIIDYETGKILRRIDEDIFLDKLRSKYKIKKEDADVYLLERQKQFEEDKKRVNKWVDDNIWLLKEHGIYAFYREMGIDVTRKEVGHFYTTTSSEHLYNPFYDEIKLEYDLYKNHPKYKCDLKKIYN